MHYYYFLASLPTLSMDVPPGVSFETFLDSCRRHMTDGDWHALQDLLSPGPAVTGNAFVRQWKEAEACTHNAVARMRGARRQQDATPYLRHEARMDVAAEQAAIDAFAQRDPVAREEAMDRFRWQEIETLAGYDPYAVESLLAYALKLRIAERWASFDAEIGGRKVDAIVARRPNTRDPIESEAENAQT